jgi:hypothetical protein
MDSPRIAYAPRPDATPESEIASLAAVYRYVVERRARKEAGPETRPEDARERTNLACTQPDST